MAYAAGVPAQAILDALQGQGAGSRWRMERTERPDGVTVLNDAYNANPQSMHAALQTLAVLGRGDGQRPPRRTWAVVGAMLELGEESIPAHDRVGSLAVRLNISQLLVIGDTARPAFVAAQLEGSWGEEAHWVADNQAAYELLQQRLEPGDIVLFKSSNGAGLKDLGDRVAGLGTGGRPLASNDTPQETTA